MKTILQASGAILLVVLVGLVAAALTMTRGERSGRVTLTDGPVVVERPGEAFSGVVTPEVSGTYWFEIRYGASLKAIDEQCPTGKRSFGQAINTAYGARLELSVRPVSGAEPLAPQLPRWTPMESATKERRVASDHLEYALSKGVSYQTNLMVKEPSPSLQKLAPRFVVEMSNATRDNNAWGR